MPALTLRDASGRTLALASLKGKPVLVNLWATWCAPCVAELPTLDTLAADGTIRVLTVSQDMDIEQDVAGFLRDKGGAHLEPWLDPQGDLASAYGVQTLPTSVLYDAQGREVWRFSGGNDWSGDAARSFLSQAK